ncbi:hypothetical protein ACIPYQ_26035 [Streptomyces sp. NPDC090045]|uniref:hypothetical protein n=1 Tax=Streptomyces sp. NPDC090045 TaxID=3365927 RepID=UPI0037FE57CA
METATSLAISQLSGYLRGLTQRLDPGAGWYGEFLRRDPEGMRACLEGAAMPPWDVVESLLRDLEAARGTEFAARETVYAARLRAAAVTAWDRLPGGEEELRTLLVASAAQRAEAEKALRDLTARLGGAAGPAETDALTRELSWTQDDVARAAARHEDLAARLTSLRTIPLPGVPRQRPQPTAWPEAHQATDGAEHAHHPTGWTEAPAAWTEAPPERSHPPAETPAAPLPETPADWSEGSPARGSQSSDGADATPGSFRHSVGWAGVSDGRTGASSGWTPQRAEEAPLSTEAAEAQAGWTGASSEQPRHPAGWTGAPADWSETAAERAEVPPEPRHPADWTGAPSGWTGEGDDGAEPLNGRAEAQAGWNGVPPDPGGRTADGVGAPVGRAEGRWLRGGRRSGGARYAGSAAPDVPAFTPPPGQPAGTELPGADGLGPEPGRPAPRGARFGPPQDPLPRGIRFGRPRPEPVAPQEAAPAVGEAAPPHPAAPAGPPRAVAAELVALRAQGRSGEAHVLLCEAAFGPAERLPGLAAELGRAGLAADWATLLWEAGSLPPGQLAAAAAALGDAGREADCDALLRQGVARPAAEVADAALALGDAGRLREADALLGAFVRVRTAEEAAGLARRDPQWFAPRLLQAARALPGSRHRDLVHALRVAGIGAG